MITSTSVSDQSLWKVLNWKEAASLPQTPQCQREAESQRTHFGLATQSDSSRISSQSPTEFHKNKPKPSKSLNNDSINLIICFLLLSIKSIFLQDFYSSHKIRISTFQVNCLFCKKESNLTFRIDC